MKIKTADNITIEFNKIKKKWKEYKLCDNMVVIKIYNTTDKYIFLSWHRRKERQWRRPEMVLCSGEMFMIDIAQQKFIFPDSIFIKANELPEKGIVNINTFNKVDKLSAKK